MDLPATQLSGGAARQAVREQRAHRAARLGGMALLLVSRLASAETAAAPAPASTPLAELGALKGRIARLRTELEERAALRRDTALMLHEGEQSELENPRYEVYGFIDTGIRRLFPAADSIAASLGGDATTFVLGGANLYFSAQPAEDWRALLETRLGFYPHGHATIDPLTGVLARMDNSVLDVTSSSGRNRVIWGGVMIERAWLEWSHSQKLAVRAGYILTPFGIWNMDHGTPTLISLLLPSLQVEGAIPQRQTGVEVLGSLSHTLGELGYQLYIGNGRPAGVLDVSDDKAIGGRLRWQRAGTLLTTLGASAYYGTGEDHTKSLSFTGGAVGIEEEEVYAYREWAVGLDLSLDRGPLRLRSEALLHHVRYQDGKHEPYPFGAPGTLMPSRFEHFWYLILAHRLGRWEPYVFIDMLFRSPGRGTNDFAYTPSIGANLYFTPAAQLKLQYAASKFYNIDQDSDGDPSQKNLRLIDARLVLAF